MAAFNAGLARVAGAAKALQIVEIEGALGRSPHGFDMIDFKPTARAAFDATESVAAKRSEADSWPPSISYDVTAESLKGHDCPRKNWSNAYDAQRMAVESANRNSRLLYRWEQRLAVEPAYWTEGILYLRQILVCGRQRRTSRVLYGRR
jgi:hypothetical protein